MSADTLNPVLDWHPPSEDRKESNQPYRLFAQLELASPKDLNLEILPKSRSWRRRAWLDQGQEGACTGFALAHCLSMGFKPWEVNDADAQVLYRWAKKFDQWAGEDYDGSSVQGAMEAAKYNLVIDGYWWLETPEEFKAAVSRYGAVEVGSWWKSGMWQVGSDGLIHATGTNDGGHSYSVGAIDTRRNRARIDNSWGKRWGLNGSAWIDLDELFDLIYNQRGEVALPRKRKYSPGVIK